MKDYHINIFYRQEDESYVADIPDLKFCSALGETQIEALAAVIDARDAWLAAAAERGVAIPEPRYKPVIYQVAG